MFSLVRRSKPGVGCPANSKHHCTRPQWIMSCEKKSTCKNIVLILCIWPWSSPKLPWGTEYCTLVSSCGNARHCSTRPPRPVGFYRKMRGGPAHTSPTMGEKTCLLPVTPCPISKVYPSGTCSNHWSTTEDQITNNLFGRSFTTSLTS